MHAWEAIQKTLDHIEANLAETIEIDELAKVAALSPFYYQRLFTRLVKSSVREYIKLRRLAVAATYLQEQQRESLMLRWRLDSIILFLFRDRLKKFMAFHPHTIRNSCSHYKISINQIYP